MKLTLALVVLLGFCAFNGCMAEEEESDIPAFVQSLKHLQRGPPEIPTKQRARIVTETIEQKLDHFDENETKTWKMRYMANAEHFKEGGPIFIYLGGEWKISAGTITAGHLVDMAKEHNGYLFYTEHRYYGNSKPTSSITKDDLKYLHVKQALADVAHFIKTKKQTVPGLENSKVILSGGSYSATMVVWFARLYPELFDGGWASSAPLLAQVNFKEYMEVVGRSYKELGSQQCYDRIKNGIANLESMIANKRGAEVKALLKMCNNFDEGNDLDVMTLFSSIANSFAGNAQYQTKDDIPKYCDFLMQYDDDFTAIVNYVPWRFGSKNCLDMTYKSSLTYYIDTTYKNGASRPWYFQTCNEYGWYQSSDSVNQPYGTKFPALLYTTLCGDVFGTEYTNENINLRTVQTNVDFGGMNPDVDKVYMTHGALDPWNPMGHNETRGATVIPKASHCADFGSISEEDSKEMRASKERLAELVRGWVSGDKSTEGQTSKMTD